MLGLYLSLEHHIKLSPTRYLSQGLALDLWPPKGLTLGGEYGHKVFLQGHLILGFGFLSSWDLSNGGWILQKGSEESVCGMNAS